MIDVKRPDVYRSIHKALRKAMFEFSLSAGSVNYESDVAVHQLKKQFDELMQLLETHGEKEDTYSLPLLERKMPGASAENEEEHIRIHAEIEALKRKMLRFASVPAKERLAASWEFYYAINEFISGYLMHMQMEEIYVTHLFYELCTDEEIEQTTSAIVRSIPPSEMRLVARYMIPALYPADRYNMLRHIKETAPAVAFEGMMQLCKNILAREEYRELEEALGLKTVSTL